MVQDLWNERDARGISDALDLLTYRSNLLGTDRSVCNWKGGNTSSKVKRTHITGDEIEVMWVKGSGSDLRTITPAGFTGLRLGEVLPLFARAEMEDQEMVDYLLQTVLHPAMPRPSIETLLHAFIPHPHVDHTHPDAVVTLCNLKEGEAITDELFGGRVAWIDYMRPGFRLAKEVGTAVRERPDLRGVFLGSHGLVTWGDTQREAYENTLKLINEAEEYLQERLNRGAVLGGLRYSALPDAECNRILDRVLPVLRGLVGRDNRSVLHVDRTEPIMELVNSADGKRLALTGSACPDHLVHTKYRPLWIDCDPGRIDADDLIAKLRQGVSAYEQEYKEYVEAYARPEDPTMDPFPRIILIPGIGMIATGKEKVAAENSAGLYHRAAEVVKRAHATGTFLSMEPQDAYDIEYWPLELYKLTLAPPEKELSRRVAYVTGAASGIGRATARRLAAAGAHVVIADINGEGAERVAGEITAEHGSGRALAVEVDVTDEDAVVRSMERSVLAYGGLDILVSNAGLALALPFEETSSSDWDRVHNVLVKGYFLVIREAYKRMKAQGIGGSIVLITSKNAMVASKGATAYNAAKAAEMHMARSLAEEAGPHGIRVNCVAPDAVIQGSSIWDGRWREQRARDHGIDPDNLEEFYRKRTTLRRNVFPADIAEAVCFLASDRSEKTTGCTITVDGGVAAAYLR